MSQRRMMPWMVRLLAALMSLACAQALAQSNPMPQHAAAGAAAVAPVPAAAASKPVARKPRPQLGISAAFAPDGALWTVGLDAQGKLFVQRSTAFSVGAALAWEAPRLLDTDGDPISADGENHPKLLFGPNAIVLIAYTKPLAKPNTGYVRMLRSIDGGRTFSRPFTVHADRQELTHRFESIAFDAKGVLHAIWIDKRDLEAAPIVGGRSSYRGAAIYRNESADAGLSFGPDTKVADHSCECCRIALGLGPDGVLRAMWRHVFEPNVRDHAFAALDTPLASVGRATFDEWRVDGCPHHGPGLAASADGFHAVWFGIRQEGANQVPGVRYTRLTADGSPVQGTLQRLPDERAEHASVAANGNRVAVVWRSVDGMTTTLKAWLSADGGRSFQLRQLAQAQGENDFPRLAQLGARIAVVWRTNNEVQVHDIQF